MSKKIGLAVCYDTKNFGSQLQVLATVHEVEKLGYESEIIRYKKKLSLRFVLQSLPRLLNPFFVKNKLEIRKRKKLLAAHPAVNEQVKIRDHRFEGFVDTHYHNLSVWYVGWEDLKKRSAENYDAFLCGSDQLWLPSNLGSHFYTLEFAPAEKPKIAYATSFGVSEIPWFQKTRTAKYLNAFARLSTREKSGQKIINRLLHREVPVVCDPTLLVSVDEWEQLIPVKTPVAGKYLFCFLLGDNTEHRKIAEIFAKEEGLQIVTIPFLNHYTEVDETFGDIRLFDVDAADFVNLIRGAEYVLTDSFHGMVFSLLHHKQFMVFNRFQDGADSRNSRIDSLCEMLKLSGRRYGGDIRKVKDPIDYKTTDELLQKKREESARYLAEALKTV